MSEQHERRRFERISFDAPTDLTQGEKSWAVKLLDISFKGILIEAPDDWDGDHEQLFHGAIKLSADTIVHMDLRLAHREGNHFGFLCRRVSIESMDHLRKIVELNLGDSTKLEREFRQLIEV